MSRLESAHLGSVPVSMNVNGAVAVPEPSSDPLSTFSPTSSLDSAIGDSPRPAGSSSKYLAYGGPGFSIASFDAVTGSVDRIPVPLPLSYAELAECVAFPQSTVLCVSVVGETQVWVGTEAGSLHVFELGRNLRFSSHSVTTLDGSLLCIASRQPNGDVGSPGDDTGLQMALQNQKINVLLGSSNGAVAIVSGEAVPSGGLKDPGTVLRKPRKVLHLGEREERGREEEEEEGGETRVNCIVAAQTPESGEVFWCSYGRMIVVIERDGWEETDRFDGSRGHYPDSTPPPKDSEIIQLLSSEQGTWSALSHSSTITLWDTEQLTPKLTIACCTLCDADLGLPAATTSLQISSLHFSHPYLLVGTSESDLLVFRLQKRNSNSLTTTLTRMGSDLASPVPVDRGLNVQSLGYRLVTAEHCDQGPILDLFTCPLRTPDEEFQSPFRSTTATPTSLQVLVVCGPKTASSDVSSSTILFFDLVLSPSPSPLTSPLQLPTPTRPLSGYDRCSSVTSNSSTTSSTLRRRISLGVLDGSLPKLSLFSVSPSAHSLLPLRSS